MFQLIKKHWLLSIILGLYIFFVGSTLQWGLPNNQRVFIYHMDEWHQLMSVRAVKNALTTTVPGAAHGTVFHFFLSGIYLFVFSLLGIIDTSAITNAISDFEMQHTIFLIARSSTLVFGIGTIILFYILVQKYFSQKAWLATFLFAFAPTWMTFSGYFKYDIALLFWVVFSLVLLQWYAQKPNVKRYFIAGIPVALAFGTKISAPPLFLLYLFSFFCFDSSWKKNLRYFFIGFVWTFFLSLLVGFPNLLLGRADYTELLYTVLVQAPGDIPLTYEGKPWWFYLIVDQMPTNFGHVVSLLFAGSLLYWVVVLLLKKRQFFSTHKHIVWVSVGFFLFLASLLPLRVMATGNRALVLLPFIVLLVHEFLIDFGRLLREYVNHGWSKKLINTFNIGDKLWFVMFTQSILLTLCVIHAFESVSWLSVKWGVDPRVSSSTWIVENIKEGETIGLEDAPIYQYVPDLLLKDYFEQEYEVSQGLYQYQVINEESEAFPTYVILSNHDVSNIRIYTTDKPALLDRLNQEGYVEFASFTPDFGLYKLFGDAQSFSVAHMVTSPTKISIYKKITEVE